MPSIKELEIKASPFCHKPIDKKVKPYKNKVAFGKNTNKGG